MAYKLQGAWELWPLCLAAHCLDTQRHSCIGRGCWSPSEPPERQYLLAMEILSPHVYFFETLCPKLIGSLFLCLSQAVWAFNCHGWYTLHISKAPQWQQNTLLRTPPHPECLGFHNGKRWLSWALGRLHSWDRAFLSFHQGHKAPLMAEKVPSLLLERPAPHLGLPAPRSLSHPLRKQTHGCGILVCRMNFAVIGRLCSKTTPARFEDWRTVLPYGQSPSIVFICFCLVCGSLRIAWEGLGAQEHETIKVLDGRAEGLVKRHLVYYTPAACILTLTSLTNALPAAGRAGGALYLDSRLVKFFLVC